MPLFKSAAVTVAIVVLASVTTGGAKPTPTPPPTFGVPIQSTSAAPPGPPIEIEDCKLLSRGGVLLSTTGILEIEFTNESAITANLIRFKISGNAGTYGYIREVGTFSPGITIVKRYKQTVGFLISPLLVHNSNLRCSIDSIHFVDGTIWNAPSSAATP